MAPSSDIDTWSEAVTTALAGYSEALRREVAVKLVKPRTPIPIEELDERILSTLLNPPVLDRRIADLPIASRAVLTLMGQSRRAEWKIGHLLTLLSSLGHNDGFAPIIALWQSGLLFPKRVRNLPELTAFDSLLSEAGILQSVVFAHPAVIARARGESLGLPQLPHSPLDGLPHDADGLDWPLRLSVVRQDVHETPVRLTQANFLFKRDLTRLQSNEVFAAAGDSLVPLPDVGVLSLFWSYGAGLLAAQDNELHTVAFPSSWNGSLHALLSDLWAAWFSVELWDPVAGYTPNDTGLSSTPSAGLLAMLLLATGEDNEWRDPQDVADWLWEHHPHWSGVLDAEQAGIHGRGWVEAFLLGIAVPLKLVEAQQSEGWKVRLGPLGRHLFRGETEPPDAPAYPQMLLVQPNAEVLAYRQGLSPGLLAKLSRFAKWKVIGPACTLELNAVQTYHGLESGLTLAGILQTLNQHGMKPVPAPVADLLRRWADKRERITMFTSATLVEFQTPADLESAIARGVVSIRVTDRIGLTDDGRDPDFKNLRLIGNRDYAAKPQQCLLVGDDGVTLTVDSTHSDLLLEAEIGRFAEPAPSDPPGARRYRITFETLRRAIEAGTTLEELDEWFQARSGRPLSAAGRLFVRGPLLASPTSSRLLVVHLPEDDVTDGIMQWPTTAALVEQRLGPRAIVVKEDNFSRFQVVMQEIGIPIEPPDTQANR